MRRELLESGYIDLFDSLSAEEAGRVIKALIDDARGGERPDLGKGAEAVFKFLKKVEEAVEWRRQRQSQGGKNKRVTRSTYYNSQKVKELQKEDFTKSGKSERCDKYFPQNAENQQIAQGALRNSQRNSDLQQVLPSTSHNSHENSDLAPKKGENRRSPSRASSSSSSYNNNISNTVNCITDIFKEKVSLKKLKEEEEEYKKGGEKFFFDRGEGSASEAEIVAWFGSEESVIFWEQSSISLSVGIDLLRRMFGEFVAECGAKGTAHESVADCKRHFFNWARIGIAKENERKKREAYVANKTNGRDRRGAYEPSATCAEDYSGAF